MGNSDCSGEKPGGLKTQTLTKIAQRENQLRDGNPLGIRRRLNRSGHNRSTATLQCTIALQHENGCDTVDENDPKVVGPQKTIDKTVGHSFEQEWLHPL